MINNQDLKISMQNFLLVLLVILGLVYGKGPVERKLDHHGVSSHMQKAIAGMSKSGLSHDHIMKNIQRHFPLKSKNEINDIVIASNLAQRSSQARGAVKKAKHGKR